jgi:hypothetical protein
MQVQKQQSMTISLSARVVCALLLLSAWLLAACGSSANPTSSATAPAAATAAATTTAATSNATATAASRPPGGPAPAQLIGTWTRVISNPDDAAVATFTANSFRVVDTLAGGNGEIVVNGNEIDFFNVRQCGLVFPKGVGRYQWRLQGAKLHFAPLNSDPCPVRHWHFANQDFTRTGG